MKKAIQEYIDYIKTNDLEQLERLEENGNMTCCDIAEYEVLENVVTALQRILNSHKENSKIEVGLTECDIEEVLKPIVYGDSDREEWTYTDQYGNDIDINFVAE